MIVKYTRCHACCVFVRSAFGPNRSRRQGGKAAASVKHQFFPHVIAQSSCLRRTSSVMVMLDFYDYCRSDQSVVPTKGLLFTTRAPEPICLNSPSIRSTWRPFKTDLLLRMPPTIRKRTSCAGSSRCNQEMQRQTGRHGG